MAYRVEIIMSEEFARETGTNIGQSTAGYALKLFRPMLRNKNLRHIFPLCWRGEFGRIAKSHETDKRKFRRDIQIILRGHQIERTYPAGT